MAASIPGIGRILCRVSPLLLQNIRQNKRLPVRLWTQPVFPGVQSSLSLCTAASSEFHSDAAEAYIELYGTSPVWSDYRRNHKGGIPPQKTRKTCIRGDKICGNPCPICRDSNVIIHYQNVKLLQQFISPNTGIVYDPTRTGVCQKQQKQLNQAIGAARDHGLLPFQVPHVDFSGEDYSNCHDAVGSTPPPPTMTSGDPWYRWYHTIQPDETEVAKVKKTYKAYLK
ncbi:unnamed protein product [Coregonus sp. 'balchen']|nr:unnamed protein product [Coregonus sp. 'balchen']